MGQRTRATKLDPEVDAKLVSVADDRNVPLSTVMREAIEQYLGFRRKVEMVEVPEKGPEQIVPVTSNDVGRPVQQQPKQLRPKTPEPVITEREENKHWGVTRCSCNSPIGTMRCQRCGRMR